VLFLIADSFTDSLARLTADEQKATKTTAFDLQIDPSRPGLSFHKLDRAKDKNFWSLRVSSDLRIIVHRTLESLLLCFVGHHDKAYQWAERRKLETHPKTGAAQFVEIRERVEDVLGIREPAPAMKLPVVAKSLFVGISDDRLLSYGVPPEWLADVRAATEDTILEIAAHLPAEAAEAVLQLATGSQPVPSQSPAESAGPFEHPDARRRFRIVTDGDELAQALDYPWERWMVFLHPAQRQWVERRFNGPARVSDSAGTGKTVVALHRAASLARANPDSRVLLTTFSDSLAQLLKQNLQRLLVQSPAVMERVDVRAMDAVGERLYRARGGRCQLAGEDQIVGAVTRALATRKSESDAAAITKLGLRLVIAEWRDIVDAWQVLNWPSYRDVRRLGRKSRLSESQRLAIWKLFESVHEDLASSGLITHAGIFAAIADDLRSGADSPWDHVVVDESQDISISQLRWLAAIAERGVPDALFFAGDLGQRIFQQPFSWKALGVDVRGRSRTLTINYRTTHQIRSNADRLLGPDVTDVDGNAEERRGTVSVLNGPMPEVRSFDSPATESAAVGDWVKARLASGTAIAEIAVFVRSRDEVARAIAAVRHSGAAFRVLDADTAAVSNAVTIATMHLAKGLEFRAVAVMACDDEIVPLQSRIDTVADESDLEEVYNTERHLLYVACTRARDILLVTSADPPSEFLADLLG